jgi:hypothetical protein
MVAWGERERIIAYRSPRTALISGATPASFQQGKLLSILSAFDCLKKAFGGATEVVFCVQDYTCWRSINARRVQ